MKVFKLLRGHVLAVIAIFALLVVQANVELALPSYMSEIVDVGIQQGGIRSAVPDRIRADALSDLEMFTTASDAKKVEAVYGEADADGIRAFTGSVDDMADDSELAAIMATPETIVLSLEKGVDASTLSEGALGAGSGASAQQDPATAAALQAQLAKSGGKIDLDFIRLAYQAGAITREELVQSGEQMADAMGAMGGSIVSQRAVQYVKAEYQAQGRNLDQVQSDYLASTAALMFGLCLVGLLMSVAVGAIASRTAASIARDLRHDTYAQVMRFSPAEVNRFSQASLITRCTNDIQQIQMAVVMLLRLVMLAPIMGVVAVMRVVATSTGLEWTIGVALIAVCAVVGLLMGLTMPKFRRMQQLVDRVNLAAREMLDGIMPIRTFGRQEQELQKFDDASRELMGTQLFTNRSMAFMMPLMMLVMNLVTVLIVWFGAHGVGEGNLQVGDMMAFISYTMQIVMSFMILSMVSIILPRASVAAGRVQEVIDCPLAIVDPAQPKAIAAGAPHGEMAFEDVSFRYPDAEEDVVSHVSFTTRAGRMTALIGSTGSGKSTLVQLIPRLYDVTGGRVMLDGVDVRDLALSDLRGRIGYVPQQGRLFSGTIESNLKFAGDGVSDGDVREAARIAQAEGFIEESADGYETAVSQGGTSVSGGQRQRLAIARALAKKPEVLVLDDSFSALDYKTDAALREELARSAGGTALVVVAQRIASIMHADEILVLNEGKVVGRGTHEELLRSCPTYLEIAESQLSAAELGLDGCGDEAAAGSSAEAAALGDLTVKGGE